MHKLMLTFDVEDFINPNEIAALNIILETLEKYNLKAIFFITGHMAEKLGDFPKILELLKNHEIGFHSSGHSIRPIIAEYTDVENYDQAYLTSLERETAHINPLTGKVEREGGIYSLQDLFKPKRVRAYRAPGMSWAPPHLEALAKLGIEFDFSSSITTTEPARYKGLTFYPYTFIQEWEGSQYDYQCLLSAVLKRKVAILDLHPTWFVNQEMWDSIYYAGNPPSLLRVRERTPKEAESLFGKSELLLKQVHMLRRCRLLEVDSNLTTSPKELSVNQNQVQKCYETSMRWPMKRFDYKPRFIRAHFNEFFRDAV
jgi:peptidoglycan/xylan/chitin deacetylase (PgdA/CDA1 family)